MAGRPWGRRARKAGAMAFGLVCGVVGGAASVGAVFVKFVLNPPAALRASASRRQRRAALAPPPLAMAPSWGEHSRVQANGLSFHCVRRGRGPKLLLLLHGFPECWFSWRYQLRDLFAGGGDEGAWSVVAVDMRGYGESDKPAGVESYAVEELARDVPALVSALGFSYCALAGHDWGGAVAWHAAAAAPEVITRLVILNSPHPLLFSRNLSLRQALRSWYMFYFQVPQVPEWSFSAFDYIGLECLRRVSHRSPSDEEMEVHKYYMSRKGAVKAGLNYYRAMMRCKPSRAAREALRAMVTPTLVLWGSNDEFLGEELNRGLSTYVRNATYKVVPYCSHWIQTDQHRVVTRLMADFLALSS